MLADSNNSVAQKPTSVAETLRQAKALIDAPEKWTKLAMARPSKRSAETLLVNDPEVGARCMLGALKCVDGPFEVDAIEALATAITGRELANSVDVVRFNDEFGRRHRDVMAAFDKAIAAAEKAP